jgi:hypothetical protein
VDRLIGKLTAWGYLALITFIVGSILRSVLVADRRREICCGWITVSSVVYWVIIPLTWAPLAVGLVFTVNDWRRIHVNLGLSMVLMVAIFLGLGDNILLHVPPLGANVDKKRATG